MLSTAIVAVGIDDRIAQHLTTTGHVVENPGSDEELLFGRMTAPADALILGNHSSLDGSFVERLRENQIDAPAIRIANHRRTDPFWKETCAHFLDCGGDDVIESPPEPEEVELSIRKVRRRIRREPDSIARFERSGSCLEVNFTKKHLLLDGKRFRPLPSQALVLFALASIPGTASHDNLCESIYGHDYRVKRNSIHVFISQLRKHMGSASQLLVTQGSGYELIGRVH